MPTEKLPLNEGECVLSQSKERYYRAPRLFRDEAGALHLAVIEWHMDRGLEQPEERLVLFEVSESGRLGAENVAKVSSAIVDIDRTTYAAADVADTDRRFSLRSAHVRVEYDAERSTVVVEGTFGRVVVWSRAGIASGPHACRDVIDGGIWIAFHHDVREDTGQPDVVKWIELRYVSPAGDVFIPAAPVTDRNRDTLGEEQGFEFPEVVQNPDGAITIFGRGSHRFWTQSVSAKGFSERVPIGEGGWGCRGRRVSAGTLGDGWLTARREKKGIVFERFAFATGGRPELRAASEVEIHGSAMRRERSVRAKGQSLVPARRTRDGGTILFGDLHQHSAHSDGCGTADEAYLRARHHYGDDFAALTDHESFLGKRIGPGEWAYLQDITEQHNAPGEFATLFAYEWTAPMHPGPGHKVVYVPEKGRPIYSRDDFKDGLALIPKVRAVNGLAVPHHIGWTGADAQAHDEHVQPVWEICSCHGCYEKPDHPLGFRGELRDQNVLDLLRRGMRFGFIACSDSHGLLFHHGIARKRDPFRCGLTAVIAEARTRGAIFDALRARSCYATSGAKILLDVQMNGHPMGSEVHGASDTVQVSARVVGTRKLSRVSIIGPPEVVAEVRPNGTECDWNLEVPMFAFLYLRVEQDDGEMAWSSPCFFDPR